MLRVSRWLGCLLLSLAALGTTAGAVGALEVQACFSTGTTALAITDDPAACPPANRLDAISAIVTVDYVGAQSVGRPLVITKNVDPSSPGLFLNAAIGRLLPSVLVVFYDGAGGKRGARVMSILLSTAQIKEFTQAAQDQKNSTPTETISFGYNKLQMRDDVTGTSSCWDFNTDSNC